MMRNVPFNMNKFTGLTIEVPLDSSDSASDGEQDNVSVLSGSFDDDDDLLSVEGEEVTLDQIRELDSKMLHGLSNHAVRRTTSMPRKNNNFVRARTSAVHNLPKQQQQRESRDDVEQELRGSAWGDLMSKWETLRPDEKHAAAASVGGMYSPPSRIARYSTTPNNIISSDRSTSTTMTAHKHRYPSKIPRATSDRVQLKRMSLSTSRRQQQQQRRVPAPRPCGKSEPERGEMWNDLQSQWSTLRSS